MRKNTLLLCLCTLAYVTVFCQINRQTLYIPNYNLMNPSILKCSDGSGYWISGSAVIDANTSEAFLVKINNEGNALWTQLYQINGSQDTRSYGMAEHTANGTVLLTGYYEDNGRRLPYILEADATNGNFISAVDLDVCDNVASSNCSGYGLDIIVDSNDDVLVAGFADDGPLNSSSTVVHGYVFKLDANLNSDWFKAIESDIPNCSGCVNCPSNKQYPMVGRIIELPGKGYFITGSLGDYQANGITQVSLAAKLSYGGSLDWYSPFSLFSDCSTGNDDFHVGVDAFRVGNGILMTSNFSNSHGFAVSYLHGSNGNRLSDIYYGPTDHYFAYSMVESSVKKQSGIVVAGIKHYPGSNNDVLFVANVEKGSHIIFWANEYDSTIDAPYYESFGNTDDRLIPFRGAYAPFINYPEMMATSDKGYVIVYNRVDGPGLPMALDLIEIDLNGNPTDTHARCQNTPISLSAHQYNAKIKSMSVYPKFQNNSPTVNSSIAPENMARTACDEPLRPIQRLRANGGSGTLLKQFHLRQTTAFPNPVRQGSPFEIQLPDHAQRITIYNYQGHKVKMMVLAEGIGRAKIETSEMETGLYFYTLETPEGLLSNRIVVMGN